MNFLPKRIVALTLLFFWIFCATTRAGNLDVIGVTLLQSVTTNLNGAGVRVAQPEAALDSPATMWQVDPAAVGQPASLFTYITDAGSATVYPNTLGTNSWHAQNVATNFYRIPGGAATNVAHVDNFEADYFYNSIVTATLPTNINDRVVNQSFIFNNSSVSDQQTIDSAYDNYAAQFNTLFVSGAGNGAGSGNNGFVNPPATCYNGIGVGVSDGSSSIGPTIDNGRVKPDLIAPGGATSFSTPYVAGAAALLIQAGLRGDGGSDTNSAFDMRTIKALLLNGAIKPDDWTNTAPSPLDYRYGAGVLNVFNSYEQLAGGKHGDIVSTTVSSGGAHPPTGAMGTVGALSGWDFNTNNSSSIPFSQDEVNHYYFNVTNGTDNAAFTATATLVWNRQRNQTAINNLDLFLYNAASSNLVAASTSAVDNVEHIFIPKLPQGRYDLQVWMSASGINPVNNSEPYALAWEFFSIPLSIAPAQTNVALSWPVYPTGFTVESTTNLISPAIWSAGSLPPPILTNNQNYILLNATNAAQFFRLRRP
jgi:Subtilase family